MHFANPEAFWLLLALPPLVAWSLRSRRRGAARFSALGLAAGLPNGWSLLGPTLLTGLRLAALTLLIITLARPQTSDAREKTHTQGIAIQLVIDNSYSMRNQDYDLGDHSISRLEAVKHAVRLFVVGGDHGLKGRPNDRIGIITFARDPDVVCPLTIDHAAVLDALEHIQLSAPVGTNIGDALAWALDRIRDDPTKQKVIILLTDGSNNVREGLPPLDAAQLAADLKIKVYTIGAVGNRFGRLSAKNTEDSVDEPMMEKIAEKTGGKYFRATDTAGLAGIYEEIDRLETTTFENSVRVSHKEWYLLALMPALGLLLAERALSATRFLRIP